MAEKHLKKGSASLVIMQIKTTATFHLTPIIIAKIKKSGDSRCWRECGERRILIHCWWDYKLVQPLWKSVWPFLRKLGVTPLEDPAIPLLDIYPEDSPASNKDMCSTKFISDSFIIATSWKKLTDVPQWRNGYRKCGIFPQSRNSEYPKHNSHIKSFPRR